MRTTSSLELTTPLKFLFKEFAKQLKGTDRQPIMATVFMELRSGDLAWAERELDWNRDTIRKEMHELQHGAIRDGFDRQVDEQLPNLLEDMRAVVEPKKSTDPLLKSQRKDREL